MTIRLVASDLDGTLFDTDHVPAPRTVEAVNALVDTGVIVAAVTGRSWFGGAERATSTGAQLGWFIGSNGGHRLNLANHTLEERLLFDPGDLDALVARLDAEIDGLAYGFEHHGGFWYSDRFIELYPTSIDGGARRNTIEAPRNDDVGKLFVSHDRLRTIELVEALAPSAPPSMHVTTSGIHFVEITPAGADKGAALARLCAGLGIDRSEVIAFGDNYNDVTMLEWAGRGVAMGNADDPIKSIADEVAATNAEHGVAQILETLL